MRITSFSIKNFKGIGDAGVTIDFSPVTLLFGANNSGKSTIIQALHLAREVICNGNLSPNFVQGGGMAISLGGFQSFVHRHELDREIAFNLAMEIENLPEYYSDYDAETPVSKEYNALMGAVTSVAIEITLTWHPLSGAPFISSYAVDLNGERFTRVAFSSPTAAAVFSGCNPIMFFSEQSRANLKEKIANAYEMAESDDFGDAFEALQELLREIIPGCFEKFVDYAEMLHSLGVRTSLAENLLLPPAPGTLLFSWSDWGTPLDADDINWWIPESLFETEKNTIDAIETAKALFSSLILGPGALVAQALSQMSYIGSVRTTPERHFVPQSLTDANWSDGMAAWIALTEQTHILGQVNNEIPLVLGKDFGLVLAHQAEGAFDLGGLSAQIGSLVESGDEIDPARLQSLIAASGTGLRNRLIFTDSFGVTALPCELGHGVSQIIPLITAPFALGKNDGILAIEEPESNIHPAWQVELAEFFLRSAGCKSSKLASMTLLPRIVEDNFSGVSLRVLLETHSEHIMLRLLRRIRETSEGSLPEDTTAATIHDVAVYYIQKDANGCTEALRMEITPGGDFARQWPKGFFEEREEELF